MNKSTNGGTANKLVLRDLEVRKDVSGGAAAWNDPVYPPGLRNPVARNNVAGLPARAEFIDPGWVPSISIHPGEGAFYHHGSSGGWEGDLLLR